LLLILVLRSFTLFICNIPGLRPVPGELQIIFDCLRISQQITMSFGVDINKDLDRRVLAKHYDQLPMMAGRHG